MPTSQKARAVVFNQIGGPEVLTIESVSVPSPTAGEVRIQVKAIGINRADSMYRRGVYLEEPVFPARLGYEAAGIVEAVGANVSNVKIGDAVSVIPAFSLHQYAMHGELVLAPAYAVEKHPTFLSFTEAASLWTIYLTAYGLLRDRAQVREGQFVVINAASSGVGLAAIQTANAAGAISIALTTTSSKKEAISRVGAAHVIVTGEQDLLKEIAVITNGKGVDVAIDAVGGLAFSDLIKAAAPKGKILIYGTVSHEPATVATMDILSKNLNITGFTVADVNVDPARLQAAKDFIYKGLQAGKLKPVIAKTFPFEEIVEAHRFLESNKQVGKIVVTL